MDAVLIPIVLAVLCIGGLIFWALVIQPRSGKTTGDLSGADAWAASGLAPLPSGDAFELYQVVPTAHVAKAEYLIRDESGREWGRYSGNGVKSAEIEYGGKRAKLYIQGDPFGGTVYAGKVGGASDRSIVIRDSDHLIAEVWRERVFPSLRYRLVYRGDRYDIAAGGMRPTRPGSITGAGGQPVGAFRRPSASSRNFFVALRRDLPGELKICCCAICLLR